jgi:hypothetical protein
MDTYFGKNKFIGPLTITKKCGQAGKGIKIINTLELSDQSQVEIIVECEHGQRSIRWSRRAQPCKQCAIKAGVYNTSPKGRIITWGDKISEAKKDVKATEEHKKALSLAQYGITNEEDWPGFYAKSEIAKIRDSIEYKNFREKVMIRDNYCCQLTGRKGHLVVHHLDGVSLDKSKILDIDNGITLYVDVHKAFHSKYTNKKNTKAQFEEFSKAFDTIEE